MMPFDIVRHFHFSGQIQFKRNEIYVAFVFWHYALRSPGLCPMADDKRPQTESLQFRRILLNASSHG